MINVHSSRRRQSENEDNMEFDDRIDAPAMQTVEKEEKTNEKDNSSESKNNASLSNICDFDLDELVSIQRYIIFLKHLTEEKKLL